MKAEPIVKSVATIWTYLCAALCESARLDSGTREVFAGLVPAGLPPQRVDHGYGMMYGGTTRPEYSGPTVVGTRNRQCFACSPGSWIEAAAWICLRRRQVLAAILR